MGELFFISLRVEYLIVLLSGFIMIRTLYRRAASDTLKMFAVYVVSMFVFSIINLFSAMADVHIITGKGTVFVINLLYMLSVSYGAYRWFIYEEAVARARTLDKFYKKLIWFIPVIVLFVLAVSSWKTGLLFNIDDTGMYHRGTWWMVQFLICYFYIFAAILRAFIYLLRNRDSSNLACVVLGVNSIIVLIGGILQAFYGHSHIAIAAALGTVVSYVELYTKEEKTIEKNEALKDVLHDKEEKNKELEKAISNFKKADYDRRTDFLTGLRSRQDMFEILSDSLSGNIDVITSMYMIDIDNFKLLNDRYGHIYGDECLKKIGQALNEYGEKNNLIFYRYGGEEMFGIGFKNTKTPETIAKEIVELVAGLNIKREDTPLGYVTVSLGYTTNNNRYEKMIDKADKAMYHAKKQGKNQFACYEDIEDTNI